MTPDEAMFVLLFFDQRPVLRIYQSTGEVLDFYLTIYQLRDLAAGSANLLASMSLKAQDRSTSNVAGNIEGASHANGR